MSDKGLLTARFLLRAAIVVVVVVEVTLAIGILLRALAANPDAGFTEWAYRNQDRLMAPFEDIFDDRPIGDSDGVIDVSGLFALAVYGCLLVPLSLALGWVRRTGLRIEDRKYQAADEARQARMFGGDPESAVVESVGINRRFQSMLDRVRAPKRSASGDD